jgi:catechol 2,3-dioxygenase-like lactoylglutathione lyase family enzyme
MNLRHVALACSSEEKADRFYADLLGLKKAEPKRLLPDLSKAIFNVASEQIIINYVGARVHFEIFICNRHIKSDGKIEHVCLDVVDLDDFLAKCRRLDVKIVQVPKADKLLTFIMDYDDNLFEIISKG